MKSGYHNVILFIAIGNLFINGSTAAVGIVWFHAHIVHWVVQFSLNCWEFLHLRTVVSAFVHWTKAKKPFGCMATATHSMKTYAQWTHSACCFCDLRFHNTQQVTVNPIASPTSTTTRRPITPPKEAIGQLPPITSWCVLHTTPRSMEWSQLTLTVGVQLRVLLVFSVQLYTGVPSVVVPFLNTSAPIIIKN